jgi:transposase InsO family protein
MVREKMGSMPGARLVHVLPALGLATSSWYSSPKPKEERKRPGPAPKPVPPEVEAIVMASARTYPWWGYKKIAVVCRRHGHDVSTRQAYKVFRKHHLFQKRLPREAELYQAAKLFELLPQKPNDLWQMDVTYIHVPGHGWWYAVTVIDYYSRYLLAAYFTSSYCAPEVNAALELARAEAERIHGPLSKPPFLVTDNGPSFKAWKFADFIRDMYSHVRIRYHTPTQLGLLERFHRTLKQEEVYWNLYESPAQARECLAVFHRRYNTERPHWALIPEDGGDPLTPEDVYFQGMAIKLPKWQKWARAARKKLEELHAIQDKQEAQSVPA